MKSLALALCLALFATAAADAQLSSVTTRKTLTALNQDVIVNAQAAATVGVQATISGTLTVAFEASIDGETFFTVNAYTVVTAVAASNATATGRWIVPASGYRFIRVRCTAFTSGSAIVDMATDSGAQVMYMVQPTAASAQSTTTITSQVPPTSTRANSTALEASRVIKPSAGQLYSVQIYNGGTSAFYVQLFDSTTVPADGTAPVSPPLKVMPDTTVAMDVPVIGMNFTTGIAVAASSTPTTKTVTGAVAYFSASYR